MWALAGVAALGGVVAAVAVQTLGSTPGPCPGYGGSQPESHEAATVDFDAAVPAFSHAFIIVLENEEAESVLTSKDATYLQGLQADGALLKNFYGICHPSLPNYLAMIGGDTFGVHSDCTGCLQDASTIIDGIEATGRTWKAYMEGMPSACFTGGQSGKYYQKHNPFIYFKAIRENPARCARTVPYTQFATDRAAGVLPDYVWITPDICNDAHDCGIGQADRWLRGVVPMITTSQAFKEGGVLFITFDEGDSKLGCCGNAAGGRIFTLVLSPLVKPGSVSELEYSHYSLLKTVATAWGFPAPGKAAAVAPIQGIWR